MASTPLTILIVDDDKLVRATYAHAFENHGHTVRMAGDGNAVVAMLDAEPIDIVLLDVFMPEKDGLQTLLEIKQQHPDVRVYVMTGGHGGKFDFLAVAKKFGAQGVLQKPISPKEVLRVFEDDEQAGRAPPERRAANSEN